MLRVFIVTLAIFFVPFVSHSIEAWEGTRFFYTSSLDSARAYKVSFDSISSGVVAGSFGSSRFDFVQVDGEITLTLKTPWTNVFYFSGNHPETDELGQFERIVTIEKLVIYGNSQNPHIKVIFLTCERYLSNVSPALEECSRKDSNSAQYAKMNTPNKDDLIELSLLPRKLIALTGSQFLGTAFTLSMDGSVHYSQFGSNGTELSGWRKMNLSLGQKSKWRVDEKALTLYSESSGSVKIYGIRQFEGVTRVLVESLDENLNTKSLHVGALAMDSGPKIDVESTLGVFRPVQVGTTHSFDDVVYFNFYNEGIGSIEHFAPGDPESTHVYLQWSLVGDSIQGDRYVTVEPGYGGNDSAQFGRTPRDKSEHLKCLEEITAGLETCKLWSRRNVKVLSIEGNRWTTLRTREFYASPEDESPDRSEMSIFVMYKKDDFAPTE